MTELENIFAELGISLYLTNFLEQGFDSWDTILDITESDFDALGVKLGHRRKLQRKIANSRGLSADRALASPTQTTPVDDRLLEEPKPSLVRTDTKDVVTQGAKRKYRRHPKPDDNAPERPPSAYVIFSNKMRDDLKGRNLSFTEIAKLVGENWQNLSPADKEPYEQQACAAKEKYNSELSEYKKTKDYRDYSLYLVEFKARHASNQQMSDLDGSKRPKLEPLQASTASTISTTSAASIASITSSASSVGSQQGNDGPPVRLSLDQTMTSGPQWKSIPDQLSPSLPARTANPSQPPVLTLSRHASQCATGRKSPTVLPGYRESMIGPPSHAFGWREGQREGNPLILHKLPSLTEVADRRPSFAIDQLGGHSRCVGSSISPPSLSSDSTVQSAGSSASGPSTYFSSRAPMEPCPPSKPFPPPMIFPPNPGAGLENQLPPLRGLSPSPGAQQSPIGTSSSCSLDEVREVLTSRPYIGTHPGTDFPTSMAPMRGYSESMPQYLRCEDQDARAHDYNSEKANEDSNLAGINTLLRAGEILNRNVWSETS